MKVTYFINPYGYTYIHEYEKRTTNLSFLERSRIFVYEYLSDILKEYLDLNQLEFYYRDCKDNKIDDSSEMKDNIIVYIKDPIYTPSYPYHEILKKMDIPEEDFNCLYYWCSSSSKSSYGLNGLSRKNGKIDTYYLNVIINDEDDLKELFYTTEIIEMCKKRIIFLRNNL